VRRKPGADLQVGLYGYSARENQGVLDETFERVWRGLLLR